MKTKFSELLRVKKEALKEMERAILTISQHIERRELEIEAILREILEIVIPSLGTYAEFLRIQEIKRAHIEEMEQKRLEVAQLRAERTLMREHLKELNLEYEKAKYLENLEIQKMLARKKHQESVEMDEISLMLYNTRTLAN
ncbi:MAG: flagellar export protein FliJ [Wolinella sp.]